MLVLRPLSWAMMLLGGPRRSPPPPLPGAEAPPVRAAVDQFVVQHEPARLTDDFRAFVVANQVLGPAFWALSDDFNLAHILTPAVVRSSRCALYKTILEPSPTDLRFRWNHPATARWIATDSPFLRRRHRASTPGRTSEATRVISLVSARWRVK